MSTATHPGQPLEPPSVVDTGDSTPYGPCDDLATTSTMSSSTNSTNSSTNGRPYTPSSGPATPSTLPRELETESIADDTSEADSTSAPFATVAPITQAALRQKYHRHMARSAAKRDSVASLPSIQTLRAHFGGGSAKTEHRAGHGVGIRFGGLGDTPEDEEDTAAIGSVGLGRPPPSRPWKEIRLTRVAPAEARVEAAALANAMRKRWGVDRGEPDSPLPLPTNSTDVRSVFVDTARAVRRVRNLGLSLAGQRRVSGTPRNGPAFSTPSRPAKPQSRIASGPIAGPKVPEPTAPVRRAALDLLANLRTFEERVRVKHDAPTVVVIPDGEGVVASPTDERFSLDRSSSTSPPPDLRRLSISSARPSSSSLEDSLFSDDEDWNINLMAREADSDDRPREPWEDRLITEDREYSMEDGQWEAECGSIRDAARKWADAVDRVFGERQSAPVVSWVTTGSDMDRLRAFLVAHLSAQHAALLPATDDALVTRLADGYLAVQAYNAMVQASDRPWGFIPDEDVHDTLRNTDDDTKEWTFRRVANLTAWAAAIRLRYSLPIVLPHAAVLAPPTLPDGKPIPRAVSSAKKRKDESIDFDPLLVAKHGGEAMLRSLLLTWVSEVVREVQRQKGDGDGAGAKKANGNDDDAAANGKEDETEAEIQNGHNETEVQNGHGQVNGSGEPAENQKGEPTEA